MPFLFFKKNNILNDLKAIGKILKQRRVELGLTQLEVAFRSNIAQNTVCEIELGHSDFRISTLMKILKILEIDFDTLAYNSSG